VVLRGLGFALAEPFQAHEDFHSGLHTFGAQLIAFVVVRMKVTTSLKQKTIRCGASAGRIGLGQIATTSTRMC
jgi:hypothetical protein